MLPASTLRLAPLAREYGHICRWIWLALPEDANSEVTVTLVEYPHLTPLAREALIRYRLHNLRHEVWDQKPTRVPRADHGMRPSKLKRRRGYRHNREIARGA